MDNGRPLSSATLAKAEDVCDHVRCLLWGEDKFWHCGMRICKARYLFRLLSFKEHLR
jgi:hypothetical protein